MADTVFLEAIFPITVWGWMVVAFLPWRNLVHLSKIHDSGPNRLLDLVLQGLSYIPRTIL